MSAVLFLVLIITLLGTTECREQDKSEDNGDKSQSAPIPFLLQLVFMVHRALLLSGCPQYSTE